MIIGPTDTPFEDGTFRLIMHFEEQYPNKPPSVKFISQMFHPNVYATGELCLDILQNRWSPTYDVAAILTSIQRYEWKVRVYPEGGFADLDQPAQRPKHIITSKRGGIKSIQGQQARIHEEGEGDCGEELGRLSLFGSMNTSTAFTSRSDRSGCRSRTAAGIQLSKLLG